MSAGQGFGPLATDVGRALFGYRWGEHVGPLLFYVIERSWRWGETRCKGSDGSWPDAVPCPISPGELARLWDVPRQRVHEALRWLIAARVLFESKDGYVVNKNAHQWVEPRSGGLLLRPAMLTYAATARGRKHVIRKHKPVTPQRDDASRASVTGCHAPALQGVTPQRDDASRASVTGLIEARAEEHPTGLQEDNSSPSASATDTHASEGDELDPLLKWSEGLGYARDGIGWREWVATQLKFHTPPSWIWTLLFRKVVGATPTPKAQLLTKILNDWRMDGRPEMSLTTKPWEAPTPSDAARVIPMANSKPTNAREALREQFRREAEEAEAAERAARNGSASHA